MTQSCTDQHQSRVTVRETAHHTGAAADLPVQYLNDIVGADASPVFGGVYKLPAVEDKEGNIIPKIKISANPGKITNPGFKRVYDSPPIAEMRAWYAGQIDLLWDEVKRFENPHNYYVDLSQKLWDLKQDLLKREGK